MRFQRKCINKMQDVGQHGRTVLFVSHNMSAVTRLCDRGILLNGGSVTADGSVQAVVREYLEAGEGTSAAKEWPDDHTAPKSKITRLQSVKVLNKDGMVSDAVNIQEPIAIEMKYEVFEGGHVLLPHIHIYNEEGIHVFVSLDQDPEWKGRSREPGWYTSRMCIPGNFLTEGTLFASPSMVTINPKPIQGAKALK